MQDIKPRNYPPEFPEFVQAHYADGKTPDEIIEEAKKSFEDFPEDIPNHKIKNSIYYYTHREKWEKRRVATKGKKITFRPLTLVPESVRKEVLAEARRIRNLGLKWSAIGERLQKSFPDISLPPPRVLAHMAEAKKNRSNGNGSNGSNGNGRHGNGRNGAAPKEEFFRVTLIGKNLKIDEATVGLEKAKAIINTILGGS